ncbi:MAG: glycosyltransferase family 4 protein, partial [Verrucomicrobia bacterium]|nr:glycosyltransferase family 4 protein [Verrucomicrobiota bacterium]
GIAQFDNCDYSYYRGLRWLILLRELFLLLPTFLALSSARRRWGRFDVVHVNDVTMPFVAWAARHLFPESVVVVHARAVQRVAVSRRRFWLQRLYSECADAVIAISEHVRDSLPDGLPVRVIHNGMAVPAAPADFESGTPAADRQFTAAMVGMLARSKGCLDFVAAAAICRDHGAQIRFELVGGGLRPRLGIRDRVLALLGLKEDIGSEIRALIERLSLQDIVAFRSFTTDLADIYRNIDVLCFPSYLDAPGRPIFEAGFFGVPSLAAISEPRADTFVLGTTGLVVPPGRPEALAEAILWLYEHPQERQRMGVAARQMALERFDAAKNAGIVLDLYRRLLADRHAAVQGGERP